MFSTLLSDEPGSASRRFFLWAIVWLIAPVFIGLFMAILLYAPPVQLLEPAWLRPYINFGRIRPLHVNLAIFGWLSMVYVGAIYYLLPRLAGTKLFSERLANLTLVLWNLFVAAMVISLPLGFNTGRKYAEVVWVLKVLFVAILVLLAVNVWGTVRRRAEKNLYVSAWHFVLAATVFIPVYIIGGKVVPLEIVNGQLALDFSGAYVGMNDNIINFFFVHNLFNVWFTTIAVGLAYYLLPKLTGKPLYSHRLAIWGFFTVWTGQHHQLWSPSPYWLQTLTVIFSILAAIPTSAFLFNFYKTMEGRWSLVVSDIRVRWLVVGTIFWGLTCVQGVAQSFPNFSLGIHFTNWVIAHSHLAFVGDYSFWMFALIYLLLPEVAHRPIYSRRLTEWHFWLTLGGLLIFMLALFAAGLIQGQNWMTGGIPFIETVRAMNSFFLARLIGGALMVVGQLVFAYNIYRTVSAREPVPSRAVSAVAAPASE
ncbi:MAG: cbb3-type cytochrome c oxidase subunit I [Chloroflexi bacterium]|nr:cbb3-type cytochrome c oxidase subunit I [Chloroflexota bacterium]